MASNATETLRVNYLDEDGLMKIPGVGRALARTIVMLRRMNGDLDNELLSALCRKKLDKQTLSMLDFTPYKEEEEESAAESWLGIFSPTTKDDGRGEGYTPECSPSEKRDIGIVKEEAKQLNELHKISKPAEDFNFPNVPAHKPSRAPVNMTRQGKSVRGISILTVPRNNIDGVNQNVLNTTLGMRTRRSLPATPCTKFSVQENEHSFYNEEQGESGDVSVRKAHDHGRFLRDIPRNMAYDGRGTWQSFEMKFNQYSEAMDWTPRQQKTALLHMLSGKALDFCARLLKSDSDMPIRELLRKLDGRFGAEIPASAQAKFMVAMQANGETLEDWADRVHQMATDAFFHISENYCREQAIDKFCQGLLDVEAGHDAFMHKWGTIEQAVNNVRLYLHSKMQMGRRRTDRMDSAENYDETAAHICAVHHGSKPPDVRSLQKEIEGLRKDMNELLAKSGSNRGPKKARKDSVCFKCGEKGHFARDCSRSKHLNDKWSSQGAASRSANHEAQN